MKVRSKLLIVVLLPALIFISFLSVFLSVRTNKLFEAELTAHLESTASGIENHILTYLKNNRSQLNLILEESRDELINYVHEPNDENLNLISNKISALSSFSEGVKRVCFFERGGRLSISTDSNFIGRNAKDKQFFEESLLKEGFYFLNIDGEEEMLVTTPVKEDGKVIGVLVTVFNLDRIKQVTANQEGLGETGEVLLAVKDNDNPKFITDLRFEVSDKFNFGLETEGARPMRSALAGEEIYIKSSLDYRGVEVVSVTRMIEEANLGLVAKMDQAEVYKSSNELTRIRIWTTFLAFMLFYITIFFFSKIMVAPVITLSQLSKKIADGDFSQRAPESKRKDEIGTLCRAFNEMIDRVSLIQSEIKKKVDLQTQEIENKASDLEKQRLAILNVLEDVEMEKNRAEEQSKELKKYAMAVENSSDHIVITDAEGKIIYMNPAAERITGFEEKDVLGQKVGGHQNWGGLMSTELYADMWKKIKEDKKLFMGELTNKRKNGEKYIVAASIAPLISKDGVVEFFVGIERDITKIKEVDRMKTEFISLASHQLRTPLSAIKWFLEMLLAGDAGKLSKEQLEFVNNINDSNERMIELVNSLLNVSRIESGRIIIDPKPTSLKELVNQVTLELQPKIEEKGHQLLISVHPDLPEINIDPKLIRNVYLNLISNAIKYTPEKGEINIFISKDGENIVSQVSDNGLGIPADQQKSIFNKFFRANNVVKVDTNGNGLGLYLVKSIIESSGGKIWFESEKDKGTSFFFSLPLAGSKAKEGEVSVS